MDYSFKAYDVNPTADQIDDLLSWREEEGVDFWRAGAAGTLSRVMIPPKFQGAFELFLNSNEIDYKVFLDDLGEIEKEFEADRVRRLSRKKSAIDPSATPNFEVYWRSEEIDSYCWWLDANYPHLVKRESIATSFNGQDIFALKISSGGFGRKPIFFMDGGMHGSCMGQSSFPHVRVASHD